MRQLMLETHNKAARADETHDDSLELPVPWLVVDTHT